MAGGTPSPFEAGRKSVAAAAVSIAMILSSALALGGASGAVIPAPQARALQDCLRPWRVSLPNWGPPWNCSAQQQQQQQQQQPLGLTCSAQGDVLRMELHRAIAAATTAARGAAVFAQEAGSPSPASATAQAASSPLRGSPSMLRARSISRGSRESGRRPNGESPAAVYDSLPVSLSALTALSVLSLPSNNLEGPIPLSLGDLTSLVLLDLSNNSLHEPSPVTLGSLISLTSLSLARNLLGGYFPIAIGALSALQVLELQENYLGGSLPPERGSLGRLRLLDVSSNPNLQGQLPGELLGQLSQLVTLNLRETGHWGSLPASLLLLTQLAVIDLPDGMACPPLPCTYLYAPFNAFCGRCLAFCLSCPVQSGCGDTKTALLSFQNSTGLPGTWTEGSFPGVGLGLDCSVRGISITNRAGNESSSSLGIQHLAPFSSSLQVLVLSNISYSGSIPGEIGSLLSSLTRLDLSGNALTGSVPASISLLAALRILNLSQTMAASAPGPASAAEAEFIFNSSRQLHRFDPLVSLSQLQSLSMAGHAFPRALKLVFSGLRSLRALDLSHTNLTGSLPEDISLLSSLTFLNVGHNRLASSPMVLPSGMAALPLGALVLWPQQGSAGQAARVKCPAVCPRFVQPDAAICVQYCADFCAQCPAVRRTPPLPPPSPPHSPPPLPPPPPGSAALSIPKLAPIAAIAGGVLLGILLFLLAIWYRSILRALKRWLGKGQEKAKEFLQEIWGQEIETRGVRKYPMKALRRATAGFSQELGQGGKGGGKVYKGTLLSGDEVAVKRYSTRGPLYDDTAFRNEIKLLSFVHHRNLIRLFGYCLDRKRLLLVFEYASRGSLANILEKSPGDLTWAARLSVAVGAARGLDYLHSQILPRILHGDVNPGNILVTGDSDAKVRNFGMVKFGQPQEEVDEGVGGKEKVHVTKAYMDVGYSKTGQPTTKSDVYSMGVVLLQLATGLHADMDGTHILQVVLDKVEEGGAPSAMAPSVVSEMEALTSSGGEGDTDLDPSAGNARVQVKLDEASFTAFLNLALQCCSANPKSRPSMYS